MSKYNLLLSGYYQYKYTIERIEQAAKNYSVRSKNVRAILSFAKYILAYVTVTETPLVNMIDGGRNTSCCTIQILYERKLICFELPSKHHMRGAAQRRLQRNIEDNGGYYHHINGYRDFLAAMKSHIDGDFIQAIPNRLSG